ncbi:MAG: GFA family protein [Deltaproteobacteria bacterium]|nr:GFA family protein [Deltaproteobacteria bacterium]
MVALPLTGGCQCGALRYEITMAPLMVYNCHCTNCQKIGGGAFSTPITVLEAAFRVVAGEPRVVEWTSEAGNTRWGSFCGACGSRIGHGARPSNGVLSIRGGTLDDTSWLEPVADIWTRSAQPWIGRAAGRLEYDRQPADYGPIMDAFRAQGRFAS